MVQNNEASFNRQFVFHYFGTGKLSSIGTMPHLNADLVLVLIHGIHIVKEKIVLHLQLNDDFRFSWMVSISYFMRDTDNASNDLVP